MKRVLKINESWRWGILIFQVVLMVLLYILSEYKDETVTDVNLIHREIETPLKLWLNGYLGFFFRFKFIGNLNWISLIVLILTLFRFRKLSPFVQGTVLTLTLTLLLICAKGYFNPRYQLTIFPISMFIVAVVVWESFLKNLNTQSRFIAFGGLIALVSINSLFFYIQYMRGDVSLPEYRDRYSYLMYDKLKLVKRKFNSGIILAYYYLGVDMPLKSSKPKKSKASFPYPYLHFIHDSIPSAVFVNNNLPALYYYTNRKGYYYWCDDDYYWSERGKKLLMADRSKPEIAEFMLDSLGCTHILSSVNYDEYDERWSAFLRNHAKPIFLSRYRIVMYEIQRESGNYPIVPWNDLMEAVFKKDQTDPAFEEHDLTHYLTENNYSRIESQVQ